MSPAPKDRPDVRVFTEIGNIDQLMTNRLGRVLPHGQSAAQFSLLVHFARRGGKESPAQLAKAFQVSKGAMTNILQKLEAQGLVLIEADAEDGRKKLVSITERGLRAHDAGLMALRPQVEAMRSAFTEAEFQAALPFLTALRTWLDENR